MFIANATKMIYRVGRVLDDINHDKFLSVNIATALKTKTKKTFYLFSRLHNNNDFFLMVLITVA